jgi:hypothetical protein
MAQIRLSVANPLRRTEDGMNEIRYNYRSVSHDTGGAR